MKREGHTQQGKREEREGGPGWKRRRRRRKKVANAIYEERDRKGKGKDGSFLQVERERERERVMLRPTKRISETSHLFKDDGEGGSRDAFVVRRLEEKRGATVHSTRGT